MDQTDQEIESKRAMQNTSYDPKGHFKEVSKKAQKGQLLSNASAVKSVLRDTMFNPNIGLSEAKRAINLSYSKSGQ